MPRILSHFLPWLLLAACTHKSGKEEAQLPALHQPPMVYAFRAANPYKVNPFTGDSIASITNNTGAVIKTGIGMDVHFEKIDDSILQPKVLTSVSIQTSVIKGNQKQLPAQLPTLTADTTSFKKIKLGEGPRSKVLKNAYGEVPTGVPLPANGKVMPLFEPKPQEALPMQRKDDATHTIKYFDMNEGLPYSYTTDVVEDSDGNLWIGTDGYGVCKYNGSTITCYAVKEGLSNAIVLDIEEDKHKVLWIATQGGLNKFDGAHFTQFTEKQGMPSSTVSSILVDSKGIVWASTTNGLVAFKGSNFTIYSEKEGLPSDYILDCAEDNQGNIWIATSQGVAKFDGTAFTHITEKDGIKSNEIGSIETDKYGNVWFATLMKGVTRFDGRQFTFFSTREGLTNDYVIHLAADKKGSIWASSVSGGGLDCINNNTITHFGKQEGLSDSKVRLITEDKHGNIWAATEGGGLAQVCRASFNYYLPETLVNEGRVRPIINDKQGGLWVGTEDYYIGHLNLEQSDDGKYLFSNYVIRDTSFLKGQRSLLQDQNGNLWIGTISSGILRYDGTGFTQFLLGKAIKQRYIVEIKEDRNHAIWFCNAAGNIFKFEGGQFYLLKTKDPFPTSLILSILEDCYGHLWFCTDGGGLYKYDGKQLTVFGEEQGLFSKRITSIAEDENGHIWLGTLGAGVCRFDGKQFTYYTEKQGMPNNNVWSIFRDKHNQLWLGTEKGLALAVKAKNKGDKNGSDYQLFTFNSADGLKAIDFNLHSSLMDAHGNMVWGTGSGLVFYNIDQPFRADSVRSLRLNRIEINGQFVDFRNPGAQLRNNIRFNPPPAYSNYPVAPVFDYNLNHLTFHFSAIDWNAREKIKYSYRLLGQETEWSALTSKGIAEYRNLSYGDYELQVVAVGQSQVYSQPLTYRFTILPAWWQTWWFKLLILLSAVLLAILITRQLYRIRLKEQKAALEKKLAVQMERQRISSEMHDDIGAGLSGVRLLAEHTRSKINKEPIGDDIEKIQESVSEISDRMKEVIWSLNTANDNLDGLISYLIKQGRQMMEHYHGTFSILVPDDIPEASINGESRRHVYLTVKEALHNIIKHSGASKVMLEIRCTDRLVITIADNGIGLPNFSGNETGNGLKNMKQRMKEIGGDFNMKNDNGLILTLTIPINSIA